MTLKQYIARRCIFLESKQEDLEWENKAIALGLRWEKFESYIPTQVLDEEINKIFYDLIRLSLEEMLNVSEFKYKEDLQVIIAEMENIQILNVVNYFLQSRTLWRDCKTNIK